MVLLSQWITVTIGGRESAGIGYPSRRMPPSGLLPGTRLWSNKRQAGLTSTLGDNLTQNRAGSAEDETGSFRGRRRVDYQSTSLFHVFNLRSDFIISDPMWCFLKVILTYCNPLNILRCLKYEVILIYYLECTNHTQQIFELLLNI